MLSLAVGSLSFTAGPALAPNAAVRSPVVNMADSAVVIGVAADSGCGKSTFMRRMTSIFGGGSKLLDIGRETNTLVSDMTTVICLDDYHKYDREGRKSNPEFPNGITALAADCQDWDKMAADVVDLKNGACRPRHCFAVGPLIRARMAGCTATKRAPRAHARADGAPPPRPSQARPSPSRSTTTSPARSTPTRTSPRPPSSSSRASTRCTTSVSTRYAPTRHPCRRRRPAIRLLGARASRAARAPACKRPRADARASPSSRVITPKTVEASHRHQRADATHADAGWCARPSDRRST